MIYVTGPGHGGPALVANSWLEGSYSEFYPQIPQDQEGMKRLFRQFSFPGGIPSHVEAETGPLAASWHSNKFLNPAHDGAVLPILHLNGYKIANPAFLARIPREELESLLLGYGYQPHFVEGTDPTQVHQKTAATFEAAVMDIRAIQDTARKSGVAKRPRWPVVVLRTPKGWTGPKEVDGKKTEGSWRSHQVPISDMTKEHIAMLDKWMRSYRPQELFDDSGHPRFELKALAPRGTRRMGANPHANGGALLKDLRMPDFREYAVRVLKPGQTTAESTRVMGALLRDVMKLNASERNFRLFGPDETASNRLGAVFEATAKTWLAQTLPEDDLLAPEGRVMEILSEHTCQGWLEGYLLTGRHGLFSCYEAFIHIVDSMFNQHAKWLKVAGREVPWRRPIASLNYLLTSHVWRQDHNGFSHQDPGFIDHVVNKKADVIRVYLPPDANTLLYVSDRCLRSRNIINVIVAGKQPALQYLDMDSAIRHCAAGIGIWQWAGNDQGGEPDVVMACAGDVPTLETLAAVQLLRRLAPEIKVRVVNVVDLMTLQPSGEHPHGLDDRSFDAIYTADKPIIFAYHGYPWLIHRLTYRRNNHGNLHVRGYKEEGTTTTPFDMVVMNDLDRYHLLMDVTERLPNIAHRAAELKQAMHDKLAEHKRYIAEHGDDMPEIRNWKWET